MNWPNLENPPIVLAVMELKFDSSKDINLDYLKNNDKEILKEFPNQNVNLEGNIQLPSPTLGKSIARVDSHQTGFTYTSENKLKKLIISKTNLAFVSEGSYSGWGKFKKQCFESIDYFQFILKDTVIKRVSMRFINKFNFEKLDSPLDYLNTFISAKEGVINYPIVNLNYKYVMKVPDSKININVIQSVEEKDEEGYKFLFDIDVLDHDENKYQDLDLNKKLENIRNIKNDIFFKNLTEKSLNLLK